MRHVMRGISPSSVRVVSFKKPTETDLDHDYLWRVHPHVPGKGEIAIFNRSHYEDVLIVRVHDLVPAETWKQRYVQINHFERMLSENGVIILKFFLISIWRNSGSGCRRGSTTRPSAGSFSTAISKSASCGANTSEAYTTRCGRPPRTRPTWYVIPANRKWFRDYVIADIIIKTLEKLE